MRLPRFLGVLLTIFLLCPSTPTLAADDPLARGVTEYRAENFEEAVALFQRAREVAPDSSVAAFYLGITLKQTGDYSGAAKNLRDAIRLSPPVRDAYPELIEVLYSQGDLPEAREWIEAAEKERVKPPHISFLKGLVLAKGGDAEGALAAFARARDLDPSLTQAADLQMAMVLARDRQFSRAQESLQAVVNINPASDLAGFAREYQKSLEQAIAAYRSWRLDVGLAYQYDDNVVNKPLGVTGISAADNITGEADSSLVGTLEADWSPLLGAPWSLGIQYNFYSNTHQDLEAFDIITQQLAVTPGYLSTAGVFSLPATISFVWLDDESYLHLYSLRPSWSRQLAPGHIGQLSLRYDRREMQQADLDAAENRDGDIYGISAAWIRTFAEERGALNARYQYFRENTEGANWDTADHEFSLSLLVPVVRSMTLNASGDALRQEYQHEHTTFHEKRNDTIYSASAGLVWEPLAGLRVNLQYAYTRAHSTLPIYDYERNTYTAGVNYAF